MEWKSVWGLLLWLYAIWHFVLLALSTSSTCALANFNCFRLIFKSHVSVAFVVIKCDFGRDIQEKWSNNCQCNSRRIYRFLADTKKKKRSKRKRKKTNKHIEGIAPDLALPLSPMKSFAVLCLFSVYYSCLVHNVSAKYILHCLIAFNVSISTTVYYYYCYVFHMV